MAVGRGLVACSASSRCRARTAARSVHNIRKRAACCSVSCPRADLTPSAGPSQAFPASAAPELDRRSVCLARSAVDDMGAAASRARALNSRNCCAWHRQVHCCIDGPRQSVPHSQTPTGNGTTADAWPELAKSTTYDGPEDWEDRRHDKTGAQQRIGVRTPHVRERRAARGGARPWTVALSGPFACGRMRRHGGVACRAAEHQRAAARASCQSSAPRTPPGKLWRRVLPVVCDGSPYAGSKPGDAWRSGCCGICSCIDRNGSPWVATGRDGSPWVACASRRVHRRRSAAAEPRPGREARRGLRRGPLCRPLPHGARLCRAVGSDLFRCLRLMRTLALGWCSPMRARALPRRPSCQLGIF
jgi:hypothetical protein